MSEAALRSTELLPLSQHHVRAVYTSSKRSLGHTCYLLQGAFTMDVEDAKSQISGVISKRLPKMDSAPQRTSLNMSSQSKQASKGSESIDLLIIEDGKSNGTCEVETVVSVHCTAESGDDTADGDPHALSNDGMSEFSSSDVSLPEVCISTNNSSFEEDMSYEVQQAYRIFSSFLLDKHKGITSPFLQPIRLTQDGVGGVRAWAKQQQEQSMCLWRIKEKFVSQEYENITEFVADFRLMLENCYRHHGVDHWISKQAQKLEIMLEQKLTLLSRTLREKTTLAVTSKGRFGAEEERSSGGTSTRRRLASRSLATMTVGGHESIMVQTLRLEEQQRAKDERKQRELEKKEADEMSAKEVEEWEQTLLSQAAPHTVDTVWELPAIGHFLCLAQTALSLPEIIFFELERCLLMPRCSALLSKIMSSLLSPPQRRATLQRRPSLPYRRWESELRQRVMSWYRTVGSAQDQPSRAEQLGLSHQFFTVLGEVSPLEEKPFHLLPFYLRVWLLKGLCDNVYETQKDVQDALLSQPIHECRESILGYDSKDNAYIHFPHFCGADLRIYCQSLSTPPAFPFPSTLVRRVTKELDTKKDEDAKMGSGCCGGMAGDTEVTDKMKNGETDALRTLKEGHWAKKMDNKRCESLTLKTEEGSESCSSGSDAGSHSKSDLKVCTNTLAHRTHVEGCLKEETEELEYQSTNLPVKPEQDSPSGSQRTIKAETQEPCLSVGEHCYTGRSPARTTHKASPCKTEAGSLNQGHQRSASVDCCDNKNSNIHSEDADCCQTSESCQNSSEERASDKIWTKKKKRKKKRGREQMQRVKRTRKQLQHADGTRLFAADRSKSAEPETVSTTIKRKDKKKKHKTGNKPDSSKKIKDETSAQPSFKLVCTSLEQLRALISKTEDELDDLESTKKRLGRWYYKKEAVKELHSTLIRLLNELMPWEPKLVKAFQRNRLRLKKEFDDFKRNPEYNNFVREECISSSSSDDEDDEDRDTRPEAFSLSDQCRRAEEEEDIEHVVPRGLWSGASVRDFVAESECGERLSYAHGHDPNHNDHHLASTEEGISLQSRVHRGITSSGETRLQLRPELLLPNQSRDTNSSGASSGLQAQDPVLPRPPILHPTTGLPKGYTPIPTLLAKSVGNKVTLMKRPADYQVGNKLEKRSKASLVCVPTSVLTVTKPSKAQASPSSSQLKACGPQQTDANRQKGSATATAAFPKALQAIPSHVVPQSQFQVVGKVSDRLGQLVRTEGSGSVKLAVHPSVDQNAREKKMQQVVILPSHLLIKTTEGTVLPSPSHQMQSAGMEVAASKVTTPLCMSTNVPGFAIPESKIPVQQVAPMTKISRTPSPSVSACPQQEGAKTPESKEAQVHSSQAGAAQAAILDPLPIKSPPPEVSTEVKKSPNPKQELRTVCIRDSHSILVTTRGGNTGIVKVQTSSDQVGSFTPNPVITISPQFKAFLISKALQTASTSSVSSPTPTSTSAAQVQKQDSLKSSSVSDSIPSTGPQSQTARVAFGSGQGSNVPISHTLMTKMSLCEPSIPTGSQFQVASVENTGVVTSLGGSGVHHVLTQADLVSKRGVKRPSADGQPQVAKYILVTPSSAASSVSTATSTATSSGVMFISQPTVPLSTTSLEIIPKQPVATGVSGQLLTTSSSSQPVKVGYGPSQPVCTVNTETLSKVKNITLPSGVQLQVSGRTATLGQTMEPLSRSSSLSSQKSVCHIGPATATSFQLNTSSNSITVHSDSNVPLTTSSKQQCTSSFSPIPQRSSSTLQFTTATPTVCNKKDLGTTTNKSNQCAAQSSSSIQRSLAQTSTTTIAQKILNSQSGNGERTPFSSSLQLTLSKTQKTIPAAGPANTSFSTSAPGTVQQKIIINTSTPLVGGTQIMLNNARFVVPPQGLGPGSHVLIISTPAPQKVPAASVASTAAPVPPEQACRLTVAPRTSVLPQSPLRLPSVPVVSSPFIASTPAITPALIPTIPNIPSVRQALTCCSTVFPSTTNVVAALPRSLATRAGSLPLPAAGTHSLVSSSPTLVSVPVVGTPSTTSTATFSPQSSPLASIRLSVGALAQSECSSTILPLVAHPLSIVSAPASSLPLMAGPPVSTIPAAASVIACAPPVSSSPAAQQVTSAPTPRHTIATQQATSETVHTAPESPSLKKTVLSVTQTCATTRTAVLPTTAAHPTPGADSVVQMPPVATITPIGSDIFGPAPVATTSLSSSNAALQITPATQPLTSPKAKGSFQTPVSLSSQTLGKHLLHTSPLGMHTNKAPKILVSLDGAVLNTVQCQQANPASLTTCPKQMDSLIMFHNSNSGALHTQDSALPPPDADEKRSN